MRDFSIIHVLLNWNVHPLAFWIRFIVIKLLNVKNRYSPSPCVILLLNKFHFNSTNQIQIRIIYFLCDYLKNSLKHAGADIPTLLTGNWGTDRLSDSLKVLQLVSDGSCILAWAVWVQSSLFLIPEFDLHTTSGPQRRAWKFFWSNFLCDAQILIKPVWLVIVQLG